MWSKIGKIGIIVIFGLYLALKIMGDDKLLLEKYLLLFYIIIGIVIVVILFRPINKK